LIIENLLKKKKEYFILTVHQWLFMTCNVSAYIRVWQTMECGPNPVHRLFINKVLLTHSHTHLFIYCLWVLSCYSHGIG
jgi:hypothetical protein